MIRIKLAAVAALAAICASTLAPASAATNIATLGVTATVTNNCDVQTQPAALTMSYNELDNVGTLGLSSFTWACTNGAAASVTPTSTNNGGGSNWKAVNGGANLLYLLYDDSACSANQLKNGTADSLGNATGSTTTYNICGIPSTSPAQTSAVNTYTDTVTFTFNFNP